MEDEKELTGHESLELIASMIKKAKDDYLESGVSALLWGSLISFCALVTFWNYYLKQHWLDYIWLLSMAAVIPQVIIARKEKKNRKVKGYHDDVLGGVWLSFAIVMIMLGFFNGMFSLELPVSVYLLIYGIPTFTTGYGRQFRPMLLGGIGCWVLAIPAGFAPFPYTMLYLAAAAQMAWFIPGLILRRRYLKAKENHV